MARVISKAKTGRTKKPVISCVAASRIGSVIASMSQPTGTARFAAGKSLVITAEKQPDRIYPHFGAIASLLHSECKIVRWNAMRILALLSAVDTQQKLTNILETYFAFIPGPNMITAANAIRALGIVAQNRPELLDRIIPAILQVENAAYDTSECRNVAIGHALDVLRELRPEVNRRPEVEGFIRRQQSNSRAAVARRAKAMLA